MSMESATSESFHSSNAGDLEEFDSLFPPSLYPTPNSFLPCLDSSSASTWPLPPLSSSPNSAPTTPRPSKKRARASRRAPTTVLTTDTSNFRAMVQEFTGIPAPPFATSPSFFLNPKPTLSPSIPPLLSLQSLLQDPHPPPFCQWPAGELGSVIAQSDSKRIRSCSKLDHKLPPAAEPQPPPPADAWPLSSD